MDEENPIHKPRFDDHYFAELMMKSENIWTFFGNTAV